MELVLSEMRKIRDFVYGVYVSNEMWQSTFVTNADKNTDYEAVRKQAEILVKQVFSQDYGKRDLPIDYTLNMVVGLWQITVYTKKPHKIFKIPYTDNF